MFSKVQDFLLIILHLDRLYMLQEFVFFCSVLFLGLSPLICLFPGICADIAISKHEYWSSLAPLPFEVVISAGQKAKEEPEG